MVQIVCALHVHVCARIIIDMPYVYCEPMTAPTQFDNWRPLSHPRPPPEWRHTEENVRVKSSQVYLYQLQWVSRRDVIKFGVIRNMGENFGLPSPRRSTADFRTIYKNWEGALTTRFCNISTCGILWIISCIHFDLGCFQALKIGLHLLLLPIYHKISKSFFSLSVSSCLSSYHFHEFFIAPKSGFIQTEEFSTAPQTGFPTFPLFLS